MAGNAYQLMQDVVLTPGNRIVAPPGLVIFGYAAITCKLSGDVNGSLVTISGPSGTSRFEGIAVTNANAGVNARALEFASPGSTLITLKTVLTAARAALYVTAVGSHFALLTSYVATNGDPIDISAGGEFSFLQASTTGSIASARHLRLRNGAVVSTLSLRNHGFVAGAGANQRGIAQEGATISTRVALQQTKTSGATAGTFLPNSGWNQGTPGWQTNDVEGLPDSSAIGTIEVATPLTVATPVQSVWYKVTAGAGTPWALDAASERFDIVSTQDGGLKYIGTKARRFLISASAVVARSSGAAAFGYSIGVYVNGVLRASSVAPIDVTNRDVLLSAVSFPLVMSLNDVLELYVRPDDPGPPNLLVQRATLSSIVGTLQ